MRMSVVAVGRMRRGAEAELFAEYARRVKPPLTLREVEDKGRRAPGELKAREGRLLLDAVPAGSVPVALDAGGETLSSEGLAERLARWRDGGAGEVAFIVGGAEGLDEAVLARAALVLSLGPMTWPHMLVRAMLAEQIFRAQSILEGHPYHRG